MNFKYTLSLKIIRIVNYCSANNHEYILISVNISIFCWVSATCLSNLLNDWIIVEFRGRYWGSYCSHAHYFDALVSLFFRKLIFSKRGSFLSWYLSHTVFFSRRKGMSIFILIWLLILHCLLWLLSNNIMMNTEWILIHLVKASTLISFPWS